MDATASTLARSEIRHLVPQKPRVAGALVMVPLVPDVSRAPAYHTLDEALASGWLELREHPGREKASEIQVENRGDRPVLLLQGETLVGARQDRMIDASLLVKARSTLVVPVSCVEAGRWGRGGAQFSGAGPVSPSDVRTRILRPPSGTDLGETAQQQVWRAVAQTLEATGTPSETCNLSAVYEARGGVLAACVEQLQPVSGQTGALFAHAARGLLGLDLFTHAATFSALCRKLVSGYTIDALLSPCAVPDSRDWRHEAAEVLAELEQARLDPWPLPGLGHHVWVRTPRLAGSALLHDDALVHLSAFPTRTRVPDGRQHPASDGVEQA